MEKKVTFLEHEIIKLDEHIEHSEVILPEQNVIAESDSTAEASDFMVDLMNNYLEHYKKACKKSKNFSLLDEIDVTDLTSTNFALEDFYEEMIKFKLDDLSNPGNTKIIPFDTNIDKMYVITKNNENFVMSKSFFATLIELTNLKKEEENIKNGIKYELKHL